MTFPSLQSEACIFKEWIYLEKFCVIGFLFCKFDDVGISQFVFAPLICLFVQKI